MKRPKTGSRVNPLEMLEALLGDKVFFVPCKWGTKRPIVPYTKRSFESTKSADYRRKFAERKINIAIYGGTASAGLCALDFDRDEDLKAFVAVNPALGETLRTRGSRGGMVWLRIDGDYPPSCNTDNYEWRADNRLSTIYGRHPKGMDYKFLVKAEPVSLLFSDIAWPKEWELPWVGAAERDATEALEREYGRPFYTNKEGRVNGLNERYWAGLYARENRVLYDPDEEAFYLYSDRNGLWQTVTSASIQEAIASRILEVSRQVNKFTLEKQIRQVRLNAVVTALKAIVERPAAFVRKKPFIHVANGMIRFSEDGDIKFGGFSFEDYSRNKSPYSFDEKARCPRFLDELILPAVERDDADLLQRWTGLALFGYNLPQRFLILHGTPNGGKGTLVRIIQSLIGLANTYQLRTECLHERFETFRYRRKTLLIGPDVAGDFLMRRGASMLKVLVGGDPISAEGKGLNGDFQMFGTFNVVVTCNSRLRIRLEDDAGAWRRRLLAVPYEKPAPKKRILDFHHELLREEGSGILRWALTGFMKLHKEFEEIGDFKLTKAQMERIDSLLAESDSLKLFVRAQLEQHPHSNVTTSEISQAYAEFCAEKGWNALPTAIVERSLPDIMLEEFHVTKSNSIERDGRKSNRGWRNVGLREAAKFQMGRG